MLLIRRLVPVVALSSLLCAGVASAAPDKKDECFNAYEQGQRSRKAGKLRAARAQFVTCAATECPAFTVKECTQWLDDADRALPSVVITAKDIAGNPTSAVTVYVDDERVADKLDGRAVTVDPGTHEFRYEMEGGKQLREQVVVNEGKKDQSLVADFSKLAPPKPPPPPEQPKAETPRSIPTAAWVLGGVAVAGLASFTVFGLLGHSTQGCAPTCTQSQVDTLRRQYLIADLSLLVALASGGVATYLVLSSQPSTKVGVGPTPGGAFVSASSSF